MLEKEIQREIDELNALFQEQPGLDAERNEVTRTKPWNRKFCSR